MSDCPYSFDTPIPQGSLNLEARQRTNFLPWRGQFSPELVETLLRAYYPGNGVVLDPFVGSGTLLSEAARLGAPAVGVEINPAAYFLSSLHTFANLDPYCRLEIIGAVEAQLFAGGRGPDGQGSAIAPPLFGFRRGVGRPCPIDTYTEPLFFAYSMLDSASRDATLTWKRLARFIMDLPHSPSPIRVHLADARHLPLPRGSVGFVITSPPYINVMNYHHQYRSVVEGAGWDVLAVARSEVGSNRKFRQNRFLTVIQYVLDMSLVFKEISRVSVKGARIVFVVGRSSRVLGIDFPNSAILSELAKALGYTLVLVQERVFQNRYGKSIREDILNLLPPGPGALANADAVISIARNIAFSTLVSAMAQASEKSAPLLEAALDALPRISPSPLLDPLSVMPAASKLRRMMPSASTR